MDIKIFTYRGRGGGWGQAGGVIRSKNKNKYKDSTYSKIKFYTIFIFFSEIDIKKFPNGVSGAGRGGVIFLTYYYIISSM